VTGRLARIGWRPGDLVKQGMLVARLSPLPLDARARSQALAHVASSEAAQRAAAAALAEHRAALEQARREHARRDLLAAQGLCSPEECERLELAEATQRSRVEAAEFAARAAASEVREARAALVAADTRPLDRAALVEVRAPATGRVLRVFEESEREVAAGAPLLELGDLASLEVVIELLSTDAVNVQPGAELWVEDGTGVRRPGRVSGIEPAAFTRVSALGVEEQRVNVVGELLEPCPLLGDRYRVEARVTVWSAGDVLKVPVGALFRDGGRWSVFVARDGRVRRRAVSIGPRNDAEAVVQEGLEEGESVVLHPSDRVRDGVRVRPRTAA
jgi:HlyD family secretion protein